MGVRRWLRRKLPGVEDPTRDAANHENPRHFVTYTIEHSPFQKWVVFVAAVGFLSDAYDIFALNVVSQIVPWIYWSQNGNPGTQYQAALLCSTLVGSFIGQVVFGFLGDLYGRRKMYGLELIILIVGSIGTAMASEGSNQSMSIIGWLTFWRIFMGVGIGSDYPISAVITAEFAPRNHRGRMLAFVFWMQGIGQVLVYAIALAVIAASRPMLESCVPRSENGSAQTLMDVNKEDCLQSLDRIWRWVVGIGAVPAAVAIFFRLTIPESPLYLMDVANNVGRAVDDTATYYGPSDVSMEMQQAQTTPLAPNHPKTNPLAWENSTSGTPPSFAQPTAPTEHIEAAELEEEISRSASPVSSVSSIMPGNTTTRSSVAHDPESMSWWADLHEYFFCQGNWRFLMSTAGSWFLLDIPFYGLQLSSASIINAVWNSATQTSNMGSGSLYTTLTNTFWRELVIAGLGALVGGAVFIKLIKYVSPKTMQLWGFVVLAVLLLITGVVLLASETGTSAFIVLYIIIQLNFSLGPNTTTYLTTVELFPTRFRCTCNGLSAAAGKLGGIAAQIIITFAPHLQALIGPAKSSQDLPSSAGTAGTDARTLGTLFAVFCIFPALGAALTWFLGPDSRDKHGRPRSLETLAKGYKHLRELKGETDPADRDDG